MRRTLVLLVILAGCSTTSSLDTTPTTEPTTTTTEATTTSTTTSSTTTAPPATTPPTTQPALDLAAIEQDWRTYYTGTTWEARTLAVTQLTSTSIDVQTDISPDTLEDLSAWCGVATGWLTTNGANHGVTAVRISTNDGRRIALTRGDITTCDGPDFQ